MDQYVIRNTRTGAMLGVVPSKRAAAVCIGDMDEDVPLGLFHATGGETTAVTLDRLHISTAS